MYIASRPSIGPPGKTITISLKISDASVEYLDVIYTQSNVVNEPSFVRSGKELR